MDPTSIKIESSWREMLSEEFRKPYFDGIKQQLLQDKQAGIKVYPPVKLIFNAFELAPFDSVKVVIIGQDPYHGPDQAMGLSFSVPKGTSIPPSLKNIYKELEQDLGVSQASHGDLTLWAKQGVLMLNAMLTVRHKSPGSHKKVGWQTFTNEVIKTLSTHKTDIVFLLWGRFAQSKKENIDTSKHHVLEAAHPSPLARGAFFGCKHFSKTNDILRKLNKKEINWNVE